LLEPLQGKSGGHRGAGTALPEASPSFASVDYVLAESRGISTALVGNRIPLIIIDIHLHQPHSAFSTHSAFSSGSLCTLVMRSSVLVSQTMSSQFYLHGKASTPVWF
jgi:hypothetical protein